MYTYRRYGNLCSHGVRDGNEHDENGILYAQQAMINCDPSLSTNGIGIGGSVN